MIGRHGDIPWQIPADFAHFKRVTVGHPLVLGRTTFEGIGRPLPDRQSIVVTRDPAWSYDGVLVARTVDGGDRDRRRPRRRRDGRRGSAGLRRRPCRSPTDQILTEVHAEPEGDTLYPAFDEAEWHETAREEHLDNDPAYEIRWLARQH